MYNGPRASKLVGDKAFICRGLPVSHVSQYGNVSVKFCPLVLVNLFFSKRFTTFNPT